jgi:hypothetical protein
MDEISHAFADPLLDRAVHVSAAGLEAGLFAGCVVGAMVLALRRLPKSG